MGKPGLLDPGRREGGGTGHESRRAALPRLLAHVPASHKVCAGLLRRWCAQACVGCGPPPEELCLEAPLRA
eukprot:751759-Pleurochrysis_carterae.AAC.1